MTKQPVFKKKLIKVKIGENLYQYKQVELDISYCNHYFKPENIKHNNLGLWLTCSKCNTTKLTK